MVAVQVMAVNRTEAGSKPRKESISMGPKLRRPAVKQLPLTGVILTNILC